MEGRKGKGGMRKVRKDGGKREERGKRKEERKEGVLVIFDRLINLNMSHKITRVYHFLSLSLSLSLFFFSLSLSLSLSHSYI